MAVVACAPLDDMSMSADDADDTDSGICSRVFDGSLSLFNVFSYAFPNVYFI